MLSFGLVLLFATSALAAPGYSPEYDIVNLYPEENVGVAKNIGRANHLTDGLFSLVDGGRLNIHTLTVQKVLNDLASLSDRQSQNLALGNAVGIILAHATGIPGDACLSAEVINAHGTGSYRAALSNFIRHIAKNLDVIVKFVKNKQSARYAVGPQTNCRGGGRTYNYESAWNAIISNASPSNAGLINEQYCTAKRLYTAFDVLSNNNAAIITATSLPEFANAVGAARSELINFINALLGNGNINKAAEALKRALLKSA